MSFLFSPTISPTVQVSVSSLTMMLTAFWNAEIDGRLYKCINGVWFVLFALYFRAPSILIPWSTVTRLNDHGKCTDISQSSVTISFGFLLSWFLPAGLLVSLLLEQCWHFAFYVGFSFLQLRELDILYKQNDIWNCFTSMFTSVLPFCATT